MDYEILTKNGRVSLQLNHEDNKIAFQMVSTNGHISIAEFPDELALYLYDFVQEVFRNKITEMNLPSELLGGLGRRFNWL